MTTTTRPRSRLLSAAALVPATLVVVLASWWLSRPPEPSADDARDAVVGTHSALVASPPDLPVGAVRIVLRTPHGPATATLEDTPAARDFAAQLPMRLTLHDPMGQAKSGPLPRPLDVSGAERFTDPRPGVVYYWPPTGDVAIFYDDLDQSVPPPGLVRLGRVDGGLGAIASAGNSFAVSVDLL